MILIDGAGIVATRCVPERILANGAGAQEGRGQKVAQFGQCHFRSCMIGFLALLLMTLARAPRLILIPRFQPILMPGFIPCLFCCQLSSEFKLQIWPLI